jgi:hypothetical protein
VPEGRRPHFVKAYSFAIVTGVLWLASSTGQFVFDAIETAHDAQQHGQAFSWSDFWPRFFATTLENWQSEFMSTTWQVVGLAFFYFWGSAQSKEENARIEAKLDAILRQRGDDPQRYDDAR